MPTRSRNRRSRLPPSATKSPIRIAVAGGYSLSRDAVCALLSDRPELTAAGNVATADELLQLIPRMHPDVVLLHLDARWLSSIQKISKLTRVIVLSDGVEEVIDALRLGASGVIRSDTPPTLLCRAVRAVAAHDTWVPRDLVTDVIRVLHQQRAEAGPDQHGMGELEREILRLLGEGCTNREIAERCSVNERAVKHRITKLFARFGVASRLALAVMHDSGTSPSASNWLTSP